MRSWARAGAAGAGVALLATQFAEAFVNSGKKEDSSLYKRLGFSFGDNTFPGFLDCALIWTQPCSHACAAGHSVLRSVLGLRVLLPARLRVGNELESLEYVSK